MGYDQPQTVSFLSVLVFGAFVSVGLCLLFKSIKNSDDDDDYNNKNSTTTTRTPKA